MTDRFAHLSGHPALDLLNTVDWRLDNDRRIEQLTEHADVLAWCVESGFVTAAEAEPLAAEADRHPRLAARATVEFRDAREDVYAALVDDDQPARGRVVERYRASIARANLVRDNDKWRWADDRIDLDTPLDRVIRSIVELMTGSGITALHQCEDAICGWVYLDTSPRRNRRWCAAADCGDRNRARAYYRRQTART